MLDVRYFLFSIKLDTCGQRGRYYIFYFHKIRIHTYAIDYPLADYL